MRALVDDPGADVVNAIIAARQEDVAHELRAALLREAADVAADEVDCVGPELWTAHVLPAYDDCIGRLRSAYATFSVVSTNPDDLWNAPTKIRNAWTEFRHAASHYEALRAVWQASRAGSPALRDTEGLFAEVANLGHVWPERVSGQRPISLLVPPWPRRVDTVPWLLWMLGHGAELHMPSAEEQDSAWSATLGERAAAHAAGDKVIGQYRELGRDVLTG